MNEQVGQLRTKIAELDVVFRERSIRERLLLGATAIALVFMAIDQVALQPIGSQQKIVQAQTSGLRGDINDLETQLSLVMNAEPTQEELAQTATIEQLERQITQIDGKLRQEITSLVPASEIVSVLEEVLSEDSSLKLVSLTSQEPERIGASLNPETTEHRPGNRLYRHGLRIEVVGTYASVVDYLERLEGTRWHLLWDQIDYQVEEYPKGRATIELHTVSDREEWVGV